MKNSGKIKQPKGSKASKEGVTHLDKELKELISDNESLKEGISKIYDAIDKPDSNSIQTN